MAERRTRCLGGLFVVYLGVSIIAWSDLPRSETPVVLDDVERRGLEVWRTNDCQACHQLHGFGGFLGPDLTNLFDDETPADDLRWALREGPRAMPVFELPPGDAEALLAFLRAMNRTGQSQPTPLADGRPVLAIDHVGSLLEASGREVPDDVADGAAVWRDLRCGSCHVPLTAGRLRAPDLTAAAVDRTPASLAAVLADGPGRMPSYDLDPASIAALSALFEWMAEHRAELVAANDALLDREPFDWRKVPWFEYR